MEQFAEYAQQLSDLVHHLVPANAIPHALPTALVTLLFGVTLCALGAKMARWFVTVVLAVGGLGIGLAAGDFVGVSQPLAALIVALLLGGAAYKLHRYLVGLFAGLFLASVTFSVLVVPQLSEFDRTQRPMVAVVEDFQPGPAFGEQDVFAAGWGRVGEYMNEFGAYLADRQPNYQRNGGLIVIGAGLLGAAMGIFLCRLMLILFTAALGTSLIGSGLAVLGTHLGMDFYQTAHAKPEMTGIALASFFVVSVVLQAMMTRPEPAPAKSKEAE